MRDWGSQIVVGVIVTVIGTVIANMVITGLGGRKHIFGGTHFSASPRGGR
jgi:hypothetical protein